jgi:hypothetical protein
MIESATVGMSDHPVVSPQYVASSVHLDMPEIVIDNQTVSIDDVVKNTDGDVSAFTVGTEIIAAETKIGIEATILKDTIVSIEDTSLAIGTPIDIINTSNTRIANELGQPVVEAFDFGIAGEALVFSKPIKLTIPTELPNGEIVSL